MSQCSLIIQTTRLVVNISSIGLNSKTTKTISKELSELLKDKLGANSDRGYIFFHDTGRAYCGWNGSTFE